MKAPTPDSPAKHSRARKTTPRHSHARAALLQIPLVFALVAGVVAWQWDVVQHIYLRNQLNALGWAVNGGILLLFACGVFGLVARFIEYRREEGELELFTQNMREHREPLLGLARHSIIAKRHRTLHDLGASGAALNHNALAATLLAAESSRNSFLKFVHNVLILTGVFGTIVSLSLALLGASEMIHNAAAPGESGGLGAVIFGMSTALSTTMTAILAYLLFGYFYIKLTDTQTHLISRIEEVTATLLLPAMQKFAPPAPDAPGGAHIDAESLRAILQRLGELQQQSAEENRKLLSEVVQLLQEGFRLRH